MRCALIIGHKAASSGAVNAASGITEFAFNEDLAYEVKAAVNGVHVEVVYRNCYDALPGEVNALGPDFVVSLHCNAFDKRASGTEVLYYHTSRDGHTLATVLQEHLLKALGLKDRGVRPKTSEDRGGYLLAKVKAPCLIAEPFFIDNDSDMARVTERREHLVAAYARAIEDMANILNTDH